jgi:multidrug efflux pump subunit AcrA (membrane-fusion protein)
VTKKAIFSLVLLAAFIVGFASGYLCIDRKAGSTRRPLYYVDSMHPAYRSDKPGTAPDCGMELTPVYAEDLGRGLVSTEGAGPGSLRITPAVQQLYGIQLTKVSSASGQDLVRAFGRVAADETRIYRVNFGTDGYVKETHDDAVGSRVKKDQHLATVYSPEFLSLVGGYLSANERTSGMPAPPMKDNSAPTPNAASAQARADRLRNLGMSDAQINELGTTRKIPEDVYVISPTDGFILARNISPGLRFERHMDLYSIADLNHIWILAQISGKDAQSLRPGAIARVTLPDTGESILARVSSSLPEVDPVSHTLTVRLEAENPDFRFRPDMFVNVELPISHPPGITVPADAILDSGVEKRVFVQTSEGVFEPREVETGWHLDDRVQIVKGLSGGEMVASSGTFLIDSESRMHLRPGADDTGRASSKRLVSANPSHAELRP